jgi:hypothetical protein
MRVAKSAGWGRVQEKVAMLSERPCEFRVDTEGQLHSLDRPALKYPDGFSIYAVHGRLVPEEWVHNRLNTDPRDVLNCENPDDRAAWAEIVTWERMLGVLEAQNLVRVIDTHKTHLDLSAPIDFGQLLEIDMPGEGPVKFLKARCGTGRVIVMPVNDEHTTAIAAGAASYRIPEEIYAKLQVRT